MIAGVFVETLGAPHAVRPPVLSLESSILGLLHSGLLLLNRHEIARSSCLYHTLAPFTFPTTHSSQPPLTAVWTSVKFYRNWRSWLLPHSTFGK